MHAHPPEGRRHLTALALLAVLAPAAPAYAESEAVDALRRQVEALAAQNTAMQRTLERLANEVRDAQDAARAAHDALDEQRSAPPAVAVGAAPARDAALLSSGAPGAARLQLLDVSLDVVAAAGGSSAEDEQLVLLQGGDHDPRQRGFTLQNVELSLLGAVDPFLTGEAHLIYFLDPEGESRFELEEAFVTSQSLPFGLAEHGLQLEAGHFFTEFGRLNPRHPHAWHWQDQPVILSRLFGEDGLRAPGVRLAWLTPLPWFSELHLGLQNASGETAVSFLANDEVFEERPVGGRPFTDRRASSFADLLQLVRWVNALDLSDTWSGQLGLSFLHGPNATGPDARSFVYGADLVVKWRPLRGDRGWPFVVFESELVRRSYQADAWLGCPVEEGTAGCPVAAALLPEDVLRDWGGDRKSVV